MAHKRDYNTGCKARSKQYPINISAQEYNQLEELRHLLSEKWGRDVSRGRFVMWMYRRAYLELSNDSVDDYCEGIETEIDEMIGRLQGMKDKARRLKDITTEVEDDGQETDE